MIVALQEGQKQGLLVVIMIAVHQDHHPVDLMIQVEVVIQEAAVDLQGLVVAVDLQVAEVQEEEEDSQNDRYLLISICNNDNKGLR